MTIELPNQRSYTLEQEFILEGWHSKPINYEDWGARYFKHSSGTDEFGTAIPIDLAVPELLAYLKNLVGHITWDVGIHGGNVILRASVDRGVERKVSMIALLTRQWFQYRDFVEYKTLQEVPVRG